MQGIAGPKSKFLDKLVKAAIVTEDYKAFENEVVRAIIQHKWDKVRSINFPACQRATSNTFATLIALKIPNSIHHPSGPDKFVKVKFWWHRLLFLLLVVGLTSDALLYKEYKSACPTHNNCPYWTIRAPPIATSVLWAFFMRVEVKQIYHSIWQELLPNGDIKWKKFKAYSPLNLFSYLLWRLNRWYDHKSVERIQNSGDRQAKEAFPSFRAGKIVCFKLPEGLWDYFYDFWNALDLLSLVLIGLAYFFRALEFFELDSDKHNIILSTVLMSFALPVTYMNTLYFIQGLNKSGEVVRMIIGIVKGVVVFIVILAVMMFGFAAGLYTLFQESGTKILDKKRTYPLNLFSSYEMMLGHFDNFEEDAQHVKTPAELIVSIALFVFFTIFINIILLNLLIALMSNIYEKIQENAKAEFLFAKASVILEFESEIGEKAKFHHLGHECRKNEAWFPDWLQVLVLTSDGKEVDRETRIEDYLKKMAKNDEDMIKRDEEMMKRERQIEEKEQDMEKKLKQNEEKIDLLLGLVKELAAEKEIRKRELPTAVSTSPKRSPMGIAEKYGNKGSGIGGRG